MKHSDFMVKLKEISDRNLTPGENFIAQMQLIMKSYMAELPLRDTLLTLIEHHGIESVRKTLNKITRRQPDAPPKGRIKYEVHR